MRRNKTPRRLELNLSQQTKEGILSILFFSIALLLGLSVAGSAGEGGRSLDGILNLLFGWMRVVLPVVAAVIGYSIARGFFPDVAWRVRLGIALLIAALFPAFDMTDGTGVAVRGGVLGAWSARYLVHTLGTVAAPVVVASVILISFIFITDQSWHVLRSIGALVGSIARTIVGSIRRSMVRNAPDSNTKGTSESINVNDVPMEPERLKSGFLRRTLASRASTASEPPEASKSTEPPLTSTTKRRAHITPCYSEELLESQTNAPSSGDTERTLNIIERTLGNFGIEVEMGEWRVGPTVTQYTLKPAEGVKLSQITALHNDLALALAAHPIRIEAPIPGKSLVGIEVPNQRVAIVRLKNIFTSPEYRAVMKENSSPLTFALGQDVAGQAWVADLARMPHLLIAGATGSGKTIMMNALIMSLLYRNTPQELRLLLVDPKRVELPVYNGIPHLVTPVITDVRKTINALRWLIGEMDRRFDELSRTGYRDISGYNAGQERAMPYLVAVIDELADLMATAANEVEGAIIRLAQMSRAVGIHLVFATQRPSVDVITGLIKANIPARIAFSVASSIDSRTILDQPGADKLIGRGDMLFLTAELSKPKRIQGAYISENEIKRVTEYLRSSGTPEYDQSIVERPKSVAVGGMGGNTDDGGDPLFEDAKQVVVQAGKGSASLLQRRLKVGYARAARLLDLLEEQGIIGPGDGAKPREVLLKAGEDDTILEGNEEEEDISTGDEEDEEEET